MAEEGLSGVPIWPFLCPMNEDSAEYCEDDADSGQLARPSSIVKLSDLNRLPMSLEPLMADMFSSGAWGRRLVPASLIEVWLPIGVANDNFGAVGRVAGRKGGRSGTGGCPSPPTGFTLGESGMPSVSRGVREPLWLRCPGTGSRNRGAGDGDDILSEK